MLGANRKTTEVSGDFLGRSWRLNLFLRGPRAVVAAAASPVEVG